MTAPGATRIWLEREAGAAAPWAGGPPGQPTRGKTAPNRLRKTDVFLAVAYPELVRTSAGVYVDVGYGERPVTSIETLHRLRRLAPALRVIGVELDAERLAAAAPFARPGLEFRRGGFDVPVREGERIAVVRALNVLRQYGESAVGEALTALGRVLIPGGLVIEGTSDPLGRLLAFTLHQRRGDALAALGVVLAPALGPEFAPRQLRGVLPKSFIHHAEPGGRIDRFFAAWEEAWQRSRGPAAPRRRFQMAARRLVDRHGYRVDRRPGLLRRGFLWVGPEWPEPGVDVSSRSGNA